MVPGEPPSVLCPLVWKAGVPVTWHTWPRSPSLELRIEISSLEHQNWVGELTEAQDIYRGLDTPHVLSWIFS